jgi:hypothetical protein
MKKQILPVIFLIILISSLFSSGCTSAPQSQYEKNMVTIKGIVENYHRTHTYILADKYVCAQMAQDVWNMVITQGITAKIKVGNVDKKVSNIMDTNHVWVIAEVAPDDWVALETTGGFLVCPDTNFCTVNNPLYYYGRDFDSPKELQDYLKNGGCDAGYTAGSDNLCHLTCGNGYCSKGDVCVNGQCKGCNSGYIMGKDLRCYKECPYAPGKYCTSGTCHSDGNCYNY